MTHAADDAEPGPNGGVRAGGHGAATSDIVEMGSGAEFDLIRDLLAKANSAAGTGTRTRTGTGVDLGAHVAGVVVCGWVRVTTQRSSMPGGSW